MSLRREQKDTCWFFALYWASRKPYLPEYHLTVDMEVGGQSGVGWCAPFVGTASTEGSVIKIASGGTHETRK
jgi:hypothetical protein